MARVRKVGGRGPGGEHNALLPANGSTNGSIVISQDITDKRIDPVVDVEPMF
jgi:hypothetical protein